MSFEEFLSSLNDDQILALWNYIISDDAPEIVIGDLMDAIEIVAYNRGLI